MVKPAVLVRVKFSIYLQLKIIVVLGVKIRDARLRRRIPTALMAERASISRTTLNKIEKGHFGVSLGNYANVLFVLGMAERLGEMVDVKTDTVGLDLEEERLPQRIRKSRWKKFGCKAPGSEKRSRA